MIASLAYVECSQVLACSHQTCALENQLEARPETASLKLAVWPTELFILKCVNGMSFIRTVPESLFGLLQYCPADCKLNCQINHAMFSVGH